MLNNKTIAVVVPCYNEESQIGMVIESMPEFVDRIIIINDCSKDNTANVVMNYIQNDKSPKIEIKSKFTNIEQTKYNKADLVIINLQQKENDYYPKTNILNSSPETDRIILINHLVNSGKGAGIVSGYKWAKDYNIDCIASMDGDGQMDPGELESICSPIVFEGIDYVKGNRLIHRSAWLVIPKVRYLGNSILSMLTKVASGYWHVSDTQTGYAAISNSALNAIRIYDIYSSYGYPNDMLVKLNIAFCTLREVEIKPVYDVGEQSKMRIFNVIPRISWLLFRSFFKRLWFKYLFRDFHPLFLLYHFAIATGLLSIPYLFKIVKAFAFGLDIGYSPLLAFFFLFATSFQSLLFAMWMDIQDNERLYK
jgi:glycosyltransferase involved in cell wall biosynthesis